MLYIQKHKLKVRLLSFDTKKAFDRENWRFLHLSLEQIGLVHSFVSKIMPLYSNPMSFVLVNGFVPNLFVILNGTRQGCPFPPLIFVIVIEHLAQASRQNNPISGIQTPSAHHKLSFYANDLFLCIQQPHITIPSILQKFQRFGSFTKCKLNMSKTEALNEFCGTNEPF